MLNCLPLRYLSALVGLTLLYTAPPGYANAPSIRTGDVAPEFPPGRFTDGKSRSIAQHRGEAVVVLFFYEQGCPKCRNLIPERNAIVEQYRDQPVAFYAIAAGDSLAQAKRYVSSTRLRMPTFADPLALMEGLYGFEISLRNIYQFRVINPDGTLGAASSRLRTSDIDAALAKLQPVHDPADYHDDLAAVVNLFNAGSYARATAQLRRFERSTDEALLASAQALRTAHNARGEARLAEAETLAEQDPVAAIDIYEDLAKTYAREPLAATARKAAAALKSDERVDQEQKARRMFKRLASAVARATPEQRDQVLAFAGKIAEEYPDTPTGRRAAALAAIPARPGS
ncbi:MAG: redoxin domain-containing protein [Planctomycetota bacterium]